MPSWHRPFVSFGYSSYLHVVVERELIGMRPQAEGIDLLGALVVNPRVEQIVRKYIPLQQKVSILLQVIQRRLQRPGCLRHACPLLG